MRSAFGIYVFLSFCVLLSVNAELSVQARSSRIHRKTSSPVGLDASKPELVKRGKRWIPDEIERLLKLREQQLSWEEIDEYFPGRTWQALVIKHSKLTRDRSMPKRKVKPWTDEENELLLGLVESDASWKEIAGNFPERAVEAVRGHYNYLRRGISLPQSYKAPWTTDEEELLMELEEEDMPMEERVTYFHNRSLRALQERLSALSPDEGLRRRYTSKEDDTIIEALQSGRSIREIAQLLDRSAGGVERRMRRLEDSGRLDPGVQIVSGRHYTAADLERIDEMVKEGMSYQEIARSFPGRSKEGVRQAHRRYKEKKQEEGKGE